MHQGCCECHHPRGAACRDWEGFAQRPQQPPSGFLLPPYPLTIQHLAPFLSSILQASVALESSQVDFSKPQQGNQKEQELSLSAKSAGRRRRPWCSALKAFIFTKAQQLPRVEKNGMRTFWPDSLKSLLPPPNVFPKENGMWTEKGGFLGTDLNYLHYQT